MLENNEKITKITMKPSVITKCRIGQDWFKNNLEVEFYPGKTYPDYMKVEAWIMNNLDGVEMNIEEVVDMVYDYFTQTYHPADLKVKDIVTGNKVHFDVVVEK